MTTENFTFTGYEIVDRIYSGTRTLVYRGFRTSDKQPVAIKVLCSKYPSFSELVQFRNQYTIAKNLNLPGIIETYSLKAYQNSYALVMEDFGGISLKEWREQAETAPNLRDFLQMAIDISSTLDILCRHRIIHKDIKPANILINPETKQLKLIDFSIASLLPRETQTLMNPNVLEGTLGYLSPEQTGRMNRGIDYRTDFYSLGVTFYELLAGELPFQSHDVMELVHCHIAKQPPSLHEIKPEIPQVLSEIVSKLMAKNAENRYQSALGLKFDLELCLSQLEESGQIGSFAIAQRDLCDRFIIPEKLYGRETEVKTLLEAFDRVASPRTSGGQRGVEMMLVAGFSGIGKTVVVNEVHKPIVRQRGYFIKGKFDQFNRNIPFSAFVQALRDLMGQLLSESDAQLQTWTAKILSEVGDNGQVLIEVIPELELIIGEQPAATELSGSAAQNRFNLLFQKFIGVFTTAEHPLVVFLDDLQWSDSASLQLIKLLMSDNSYLLMLGAYRDNEVSPIHPFILTVEEIRKANAIVNTITLAPLAFNDTNHLVADTLNCSRELAQPLTELIDRKTKGNPFFATQFLKALYEEGCIMFDRDHRYWECDIAQVNALALTDDVVEFMAVQLQKLPLETQQVLKLAACVGNQFDLGTLAIVSEQSQTDAATALWKALQEGLILPTSQVYKFFQGTEQSAYPESVNPTYRFLHDRIQQAAYSLIPDDQKQQSHWKIGHLLLKNLSPQEQVEQIFEIVNQLNLGRTTISNPVQKYQLAKLNLQAGQKAKVSAAYQAAQNYCEIGIDLLAAESWQVDYELAYALHRDASEAAYLCGNFDQAETLYAVTLTQAQTPLDKAVIYRVQMTQYQLQGRNKEAIAIQRQSLQLLGWGMPIEPESIQASLDEQIAAVNQFLEQQAIESILGLPKMTNDTIAEMLRILQILFYAAWLDGQSTLALLALAKMTTLSLQHGNSDMSPFGYVGYGLIANALLKDAAQAYQFGNVVIRLCEQFDNTDVRGMTNFLFAADVHSWSRPLQAADTYYDNAFKCGMDAGNWLTVGFTIIQSGSDRLTYGKNLNDLYAIAQTHTEFLRQIKSLENLDALTVGVLQPIRHLLGLTTTPLSFDDEGFSEAEYLQKYHDAPYHLAWFYSVKIRHAFLFNQQATYPKLIPQLHIIEETVPSHAKVPSSVFYVILMHLALIEIADDAAERQSHWQAILPLEERLTRWQQDCPENIEHKCLLIQAEKARLNGQKSEAIDLYDQSIAQAQTHEYGYEAALANELAAKFYLDWGKEKIAQDYLANAYYGYARWGAKAKIDDLEQRYPELLAPIFQTKQNRSAISEIRLQTINQSSVLHQTFQTTQSSSSSISEALDLDTIFKASQALSSEIELEKLQAALMSVLLENAGATKAVLLLVKQGNLAVEAVASIKENVISMSVPLSASAEVPAAAVNYVKRTLKTVVLDNAAAQNDFMAEPYLMEQKPKSLLCGPILHQGKLIGLLYLENNLTIGAFTGDRTQVIQMLCAQAAISLENARLYQQSQAYAQKLERSLFDLQQAQLQLVQSEKMSALGNLVAGVAHEINNPVGFINGNIDEATTTIKDVINHLRLYQEKLPNPGKEIEQDAEDIDLEYALSDLPKMLSSMKVGCDRIRGISTSLRTFSRADKDYKVPFNIHDGIDSTLLILKHRLKANEHRPAIEVVTDYGNLPQIECFPGQLNQVFMNLLSNAIDALDESNYGRSFAAIENNPNRITIRTMVEGESVKIAIADNGKGMSSEVKERIFDHLFTTKAVGQGTGLGLAIARQIIVEKHGGNITVNSTPGQSTEFIITLPIYAG
ncbi:MULTISPECIES: ATP-binding sensor histidine kinase [unclassified Microcoleus]|uniref:trifunctional serine/threonine-protein kinase/ATP-binding protein/sensor histidine kinase n=1 Tax=unclassified Microcoleus TaxID=2642155 RepID=UPI001DAD397C|nr:MULTISPECIES: ATP-binding sensor histidine kinase [unclassified Microcoleus]TAE08362.1 MAG: GAF domain-containing protein [Oscillatoriales cyanobacterium]MCC3414063.1 AAA family ATPase [Microcoleus sp. PH2017_02_FOX_O_A]MCC3493365.1 AAA family ATPase [Microcoleus sp. PH2017_16_JOR_D_A]MCC3519029.1 AAA family ATPase [Microcoleus sp. PH2017_18_LLB_O_A]MCC3538018.1 AAA family ATPase [Microcoleus sp. PH2017_25_DOB_D_A]